MPVALSKLDKSARVLDRRRRKNAVAKIQNVTERPGFLKNLLCLRKNTFLCAQQHAGIEIALKRNAAADAAPGFGHRNSPVDADHIRAGARHGFQYGGTAVE